MSWTTQLLSPGKTFINTGADYGMFLLPHHLEITHQLVVFNGKHRHGPFAFLQYKIFMSKDPRPSRRGF